MTKDVLLYGVKATNELDSFHSISLVAHNPFLSFPSVPTRGLSPFRAMNCTPPRNNPSIISPLHHTDESRPHSIATSSITKIALGVLSVAVAGLGKSTYFSSLHFVNLNICDTH